MFFTCSCSICEYGEYGSQLFVNGTVLVNFPILSYHAWDLHSPSAICRSFSVLLKTMAIISRQKYTNVQKIYLLFQVLLLFPCFLSFWDLWQWLVGKNKPMFKRFTASSFSFRSSSFPIGHFRVVFSNSINSTNRLLIPRLLFWLLNLVHSARCREIKNRLHLSTRQAVN